MVRRIDDTRECFKLNELIKIYYIYDVVGFIFQHFSSHCLFPLCVNFSLHWFLWTYVRNTLCAKIIISLLVSSAMATVATSAFAVDTGTVTFNGKILPDSCVVDVNGTATNGTVTFNNLSQTAFGEDKKSATRNLLRLRWQNVMLRLPTSISNLMGRVLPDTTMKSCRRQGLRRTSGYVCFLKGAATTWNLMAQILKRHWIRLTARAWF